MNIRVENDLEAVSHAAAATIIDAAADAIQRRGSFLFAISGGSTPRRLFELLGAEYANRLDRERTHVFFADERLVPHNDGASNYRAAHRLWFEPARFPPANIHAVPVDAGSARDVAAAYERDIREYAGAGFDLILLGVGADGHTASLFGTVEPGKSSVLVHPATAPEGVEARQRITLSIDAINASKSVVFLVSGADKRAVLTRIFEGGAAAARYPAAHVRPADGALWLLDRAAAPEQAVANSGFSS